MPFLKYQQKSLALGTKFTEEVSMKGNKMKVNQVPSAYTLWLARALHQTIKNPKKSMKSGKKFMSKGKTTFGFTRMSVKMKRLGYKPNYARYPSEYNWFD